MLLHYVGSVDKHCPDTDKSLRDLRHVEMVSIGYTGRIVSP